MLNAGLSTLVYLKSRLLPEAGVDETQWDTALGKLGESVARRFELHCNRLFGRVIAAADLYSARSLAVCLKCYPVESITSVQLRDADGNLSSAGSSYTLDEASGLLEFLTAPGTAAERLKITYNGGYWLDPMDATPLPTGATALPADLLELWIAEVQLQAEARGIFGAVALRKPDSKIKSAEGLSADTVDGLRGYRRFSGE